jgi:hypothetical protein
MFDAGPVKELTTYPYLWQQLKHETMSLLLTLLMQLVGHNHYRLAKPTESYNFILHFH